MQKQKTRWSICWILVYCASSVVAAEQLYAQGRLSKVRDAVHRHHVPKAKKHKHKDDDEDEHHNHRRPKRRPGHRHRGGGANLGFFLTNAFWDDCHHHCHAPQVVEHVHIYEPVPVATQYVQPVTPEPVVVESVPVEPYPVVPAEPVIIDPIFGSYFSSWRGRIFAFYGYDFDGLSHGSLAALFQAPGWLGLDTSVTMFRESGSNYRDHLWLGDVNVVYEAINTDWFRARVGIGVNWLGDHYVGAAGANLTFGADWQINPNWIVTGEMDFGSLGDSDLQHAQISLGRQFGNAEWTTGYNYYDIGGETLGGVFTGLRFRF